MKNVSALIKNTDVGNTFYNVLCFLFHSFPKHAEVKKIKLFPTVNWVIRRR